MRTTSFLRTLGHLIFAAGVSSASLALFGGAGVACNRDPAPTAATTSNPGPSSPASTASPASGPSNALSATATATASATATAGVAETVTLPDVFIADDGPTTLHVGWKIPAGTGINDDAPFSVRWTTSVGLAEVPPEEKSKGADVKSGFDVMVSPLKGEPAANLGGILNVVVCDAETHKVCVPVKRKIDVTFAVQKGGKRKVATEVPLPAARPQ